MRFLCISDIHGHGAALDAVLAEGKARGFDQLIVCGDICFPGPDPLKVWKTLVEHHALCVQGVGDRALSTIDPEKLTATDEAARRRVERMRAVHRELGQIIITRLGKLQPMAHLPLESGHNMLIVHGSPADPTEPITPDMTEEELIASLDDEPGDIILCGASHEAFMRDVGDVKIVSVGSVGEAPGGGYAHATLINTAQMGFEVVQFTVDVPPGA